jgi:adenylate cyclase
MANDKATRKLAAVFVADMVGFSRLMGTDEDGTIARQKVYRREVIDPKLAEHRGRLVKTTGDGWLAVFDSAVDAVRCAAEIQKLLVEREGDISAKRRIAYRIGINVGDIVIDDDDIFGDGVNIAARIEPLAEPGGICISRNVYNQVKQKLDFEYEDAGSHKLKNIKERVRAFHVWPREPAGGENGDEAAIAEPVESEEAPLPQWAGMISVGVMVAGIAAVALYYLVR